jgi:hypothetical protein
MERTFRLPNDASWIQTYQGEPFWPNTPDASEVDIHDIAHSLALSCRWTGHVRRHFSVGQHSVLVSREVERQMRACASLSDRLHPDWHGLKNCWALWGLMHDASEAYISDVARPTKMKLAEYKVVEAAIMKQVCIAFGLPEAMPHLAHEVDDQMLFAEARDLMRKPPMPWTYVPKIGHYSKKIRPWPMWWTEIAFLRRYSELTGKPWLGKYLTNKLWDWTH